MGRAGQEGDPPRLASLFLPTWEPWKMIALKLQRYDVPKVSLHLMMNDERSVLRGYLSIGVHLAYLNVCEVPHRVLRTKRGLTCLMVWMGGEVGSLGCWRNGSPFTTPPAHRLTVSSRAFVISLVFPLGVG